MRRRRDRRIGPAQHPRTDPARGRVRGGGRRALSVGVLSRSGARRATHDRLPGDLAADLRRAQAACARYAAQYKTYLRETLDASGFDPQRSSPRFAQSRRHRARREADLRPAAALLLLSRVAPDPVLSDGSFPWLAEVEAATEAIRDELLAVMQEPGAFSPYVTGDANRPRSNQQGMLNNPAWSAFYLWKNGTPVPGNAERCPQTLHALRNAPLSLTPNRSPSILFSLLKPGAHIPPHNGLVNTRLICHLPLIVPGRSRFRVGNEVREWVEGRAWVFDDTIEHEAWNDSDRTRVILLFDVWRPELTEEERRLVVDLFEAIDAYNGTKPDWDI